MTPLVVEGRVFGEIFGSSDPAFITSEGVAVWMWRKGQRVRFADFYGRQIGPEQRNVAPAICAALRAGWSDYTIATTAR